ncbi:MAG: transporter substrate-binding domain-containing protein [Clostridiales bacterium]|nr:transporter substrate-binding domain-containing protein [Clostridiales bacterium]
MKRLLCAVLAGFMTLSLAACGSSDTATETEDAEVSAEEGADAEEADAEEGSETVYIIGTDTTFAPFEFQDESGNQVGIDMDLLAAIAEDQGFEYEVNVLGFDAAVQALESRQVDGVIAGMSITDARKESLDFSDPYFDSGVIMGVAADSDIAGYEDLAGQKVAVKQGTEGSAFAESIAEEYGFEMVTFTDSSMMYEDVIAGNTVACFEDYPVLGYAINQGLALKTVTEKEQGSSYGFAVPKDENAELLEMFNAGLANIQANGTYDEILATYISAE